MDPTLTQAQLPPQSSPVPSPKHTADSACAQKLKLAEPEGGGRVGSAGALEQADKPAFPLQGEDPGEKCLGVGTRLPQERHSRAEAKGPFNLQV